MTRSIAGIEPGETVLVELEYLRVTRYDRGKGGLRLLTQAHPPGLGRRRRVPAEGAEPVPLGVEGAWTGRRRRSRRAVALAPARGAALRRGGLLQLIELQHLDADLRLVLGLVALACLLRVLLAADLLEGLAHVRVEARTVVEGGVEDVFHGLDCSSRTLLCVLQPPIISPD